MNGDRFDWNEPTEAPAGPESSPDLAPLFGAIEQTLLSFEEHPEILSREIELGHVADALSATLAKRRADRAKDASSEDGP